MPERSTLLKDFVGIHSTLWSIIVGYVLYKSKNEKGDLIDPDVYAVSIATHYRTDNDGNPARTFRMVGAGIFEKKRLSDYTTAPLDVEARKREEDEWRRTYGGDYLGVLLIVFEGEEIKAVLRQPLVRFGPEQIAYLRTIPDNWLESAREIIDFGVVWKLDAANPNQMLMGEMRREGKMWKWKQLQLDEESLASSNALAQFNKIQLQQTIHL